MVFVYGQLLRELSMLEISKNIFTKKNLGRKLNLLLSSYPSNLTEKLKNSSISHVKNTMTAVEIWAIGKAHSMGLNREMSTQEVLKMLIQSYLGIPYRWGGDDPIAGFDCSGSVLEILNSFGLPPFEDTTAQGIYNAYVVKKVTMPKLGTLAFYGSEISHITHVAICINQNLIFEFGGGGSKTTELQEAISQNAYGRIRPLHRRKDLVALVDPPWPENA